VNDYEEIQKIYEESYVGQQVQQQNYGPNLKWRPGEAKPGYTLSNGPGRLPLASPDSGKQRPADEAPGSPSAGPKKGPGRVPMPVVVDEEVEAAEIINLDVLEKLDELAKDLDPENHNDRAVMTALGKLREHIIFLSLGKLD